MQAYTCTCLHHAHAHRMYCACLQLSGAQEGDAQRELPRSPIMDCEHAPKLIEAWILMELCSKGSLQVGQLSHPAIWFACMRSAALPSMYLRCIGLKTATCCPRPSMSDFCTA